MNFFWYGGGHDDLLIVDGYDFSQPVFPMGQHAVHEFHGPVLVLIRNG
jgi:hypothetical protein